MHIIPTSAAILTLALASCRSGDQTTEEDTQTSTPTTATAPEPATTPEPAPEPVDNEDFFSAALEGDLDTVKQALANPKAATHADPDGRTALMLAAFNGHDNVLEALIAAGATVDALDNTKRSALMYACTGPTPKTVELLIKHGANVNLADGEEHWTPIMFAAAEGHLENVRILLNAGADPTAADIDGEDSILFASSKGFQDVADLITKAKAEKTPKNPLPKP